MKTICISSSLRFKEVIRATIRSFKAVGIEALFPNLDTEIQKDELDNDTLKVFCQDHFAAIDAANGLYVINPGGYIGTLVTVEIGYALGRRKPIYYAEPTGSLELETLSNNIVFLENIEEFRSL